MLTLKEGGVEKSAMMQVATQHCGSREHGSATLRGSDTMGVSGQSEGKRAPGRRNQRKTSCDRSLWITVKSPAYFDIKIAQLDGQMTEGKTLKS